MIPEKIAGVPSVEYLHSGHYACKGCGAALAMRFALKAIGKKAVAVIPACCWSIIQAPFPYRAVDIPIVNVAFEVTGAVVSGIAEGFAYQGKDDIVVFGWAGDGGTVDIGLQTLSGAVERNHNMLYIMYDNEAYENTGIQRSSATPPGAWTTTTPVGKTKMWKKEPKKNIVEILVAHNIPYVATATIAYPEDMMRKIKKALSIKGPKFIHVLSPCQPGWRYPPEKMVEVSRLAVQTKAFPLYEVEYGKYKITVKPRKFLPLEEYFKLQGRFKHVLSNPELLKELQKYVDEQWELLLKKEEFTQSLEV